MTLQKLALKYIHKTEQAFEELKIIHGSASPREDDIIGVVEEAKRYFEDAKYYLGRKKFAVSIASIAYCEGLLDALRMLRFVEFSWQAK